MGSVPNCQKQILMHHAIRWFKCKLEPPKNASAVSNLISSPAATTLLSWYMYLFVLVLYATLVALVVLFLVNFGSVSSGHSTFSGVAVRISFIILCPSASSLSLVFCLLLKLAFSCHSLLVLIFCSWVPLNLIGVTFGLVVLAFAGL